MAFQFYKDKSSVKKKLSRYVQGGKTTVSDFAVKWWEIRLDIPKDDVTDIQYTLIDTYDKRPDLVSFDFYGKNNLDWLVLQYNNIVDINEEFVTGQVISLPSRNRVFYEILTNTITRKG